MKLHNEACCNQSVGIWGLLSQTEIPSTQHFLAQLWPPLAVYRHVGWDNIPQMTLPWIYQSKCLLVTSGTIPLKLPQKGALGSHIKIISGNRDRPGVTQTVLKGRSCNKKGISSMVHPPASDLDHQRFSRIIMVGKGQRGHVRIQVSLGTISEIGTVAQKQGGMYWGCTTAGGNNWTGICSWGAES